MLRSWEYVRWHFCLIPWRTVDVAPVIGRGTRIRREQAKIDPIIAQVQEKISGIGLTAHCG